jgi:hypothetical protein
MQLGVCGFESGSRKAKVASETDIEKSKIKYRTFYFLFNFCYRHLLYFFHLNLGLNPYSGFILSMDLDFGKRMGTGSGC